MTKDDLQTDSQTSAKAPQPEPLSGRSIANPRARRRVLLVLQYYDYRHHSGVARYAAEAGWILEDAYTQVRTMPASWNGDGIISFHGPSVEFIDWLKRATTPVVDIGEYDELSHFPRVKTDAHKIARMAVEHFSSKGYRNVGFVWELDNVVAWRRKEAMRIAAEAMGLKYFEMPVDRVGDLRMAGAFPIGLLTANDGTAVRTLRACQDADIQVPEQAAILGVDNFEYRCLPAAVPISSIDPDQERVGYEAAALLDKLMNGQAAPTGPILVQPTKIAERESTNMLAVTDLEVARALRYIILNYRRRIGLGEVSAATGLSLRRLQTRFKDSLGRTILQEINGRRVQCAQELLAQSNSKIRAVAASAGFGSVVKLIRVFKQYVGTSPKRFRRQVRIAGRGMAAEAGVIEAATETGDAE